MKYTEIDNATDFDELIGGPEIGIRTANVTLTPGTALQRGTLMTVTDAGAASATLKSGATGAAPANAILAEDVTATATGAVVYTRGLFNREKCIVTGNGDTVAAHETELRPLDILFTSLKPLNE